MKRLLYCLLLAPLCLLAAGCVENVWLPDSSGFVCITREHALVHYDLAKKTQRVVVKLDWLHSEEEVFERPALSPDGKRVALVRHASSKDAETAQILIYDLASGKEVEKSKEIVLPGHADFSPQPLVRSGMLFWAPDGKHLLFQVDAPLFKNGQRVQPQLFGDEQNEVSVATLGLYDLGSRKHVLFTNLSLDPEDVMSGFQPFTPDNRGAVVFRKGEKNKKKAENDGEQGWQATVFVNWEGREQTFKLSKALIEAEEKDRQEREKMRKSGQRGYDDLTPPYWEGAVAVVPMYRGYARLDTAKMTADYTADERCAQRIEYTRKNKVDVMDWKDGLLVQFRDDEPRDAPPKPVEPGEKPPERKVDVELVSGALAGDKQAGKTVKAIRVGDIEAWTFSPNREYLLLRCIEPSEEGERCRRVVIDAKGKVVADFTEKTAAKPSKPIEPPLPPEAIPG
jgi:hypothetical protein